MHIKDDHDIDSESEIIGDIGSDESNQVVQIRIFLRQLLLHGLGLVVLIDSLEHILDCEGPPDLRANESNHTQLLGDPLDSLGFRIEEDAFLCVDLEGALHLFFDSQHPLFDLILRLDRSLKFVHFALFRDHVRDDFAALSESQRFAIIVKLLEMRLDGLRVTRTQDF